MFSILETESPTFPGRTQLDAERTTPEAIDLRTPFSWPPNPGDDSAGRKCPNLGVVIDLSVFFL